MSVRLDPKTPPMKPYDAQVFPTPFHDRTSALCKTGQYSRWAGYSTIDVYDHVELEYFAIRNAATLFDLSPMIKYRIAGPDAERYLNRLVTRDVQKLAPGRVSYVAWCNDEGFVLDDGTLFRFSDQDFRLCCQERHLPWLEDSAHGFQVTIEDVSESIVGLALQGPTSCAVLKGLGIDGIADLRPFGMRDTDFEGATLTISRTGFTGDLGYELFVPPEQALSLWDRLMEAGKDHFLRPIGSQALNLARIEAGFIMTNADFLAAEHAVRANRGRTPLELGLEWLVDFGKGHFVGRRALLEERERGPRYRLVGLDIEGNKPADAALVYHKERKEAGRITSALWSPTCKRNIALAELRAPYGVTIGNDLWVEIYVQKELKWEKNLAAAQIVERPFFKTPRRTATPAGDF